MPLCCIVCNYSTEQMITMVLWIYIFKRMYIICMVSGAPGATEESHSHLIIRECLVQSTCN